MRILIVTLFLAAQLSGSAVAAACGADPAITSVKVQSMSSSNGLNTYTIVGKVTNVGSQGQASNTLQFVDIIYDGDARVNDRSIPPLAAGQSFTWSYVWHRASDAGNGSTTFRFRLRSTGGTPDCSTANNTSSVTF